MVKIEEFRPGNIIMHKQAVRIKTLPCTVEHFQVFADGNGKDLFPVMLNAENFLKAGFVENKDYELLPDAREFKLIIPVRSPHETIIHGYVKNNKEAFARAYINKLPCSNPVFHMHQLQNLFHALTGEEMQVRL